MNVLVTDLRYRMALAAVRDLRDAGHTVYGLHFGTLAEPRPAAVFSRYLSGWHMTEPVEGIARASAVWAEAQRREAAIFPVGAKTIAALAELGESGALVPSPAQLRFSGDKGSVLALAEQLGIETPQSWDMPEQAALPAVVKYRDGEGLALHAAQRYAICTTREQLDSTWKRMCAVAAAHRQPQPLIQAYVSGEGFGVSCVFDWDGRPVAVLCHRRLREYPVTGGPSAACEAIWDDGLVQRALALLRALSWRGIAMVEFKGSLQHPVLMEINPRVWGSYPLTRICKSGFSDAYIRAAAGEKLPEADRPNYTPGMRMGFCLSNLAAAAANMKHFRPGESVHAVCDAFLLPDGVLERGDGKANRVYLRQAVLRRER